MPVLIQGAEHREGLAIQEEATVLGLESAEPHNSLDRIDGLVADDELDDEIVKIRRFRRPWLSLRSGERRVESIRPEMIDQARDPFAAARQGRLESRPGCGARYFAGDRDDARFEVERVSDKDLAEVNWGPRFEPRRLPDPALHPIPVLLGGERLAEAPAIAIIGDPRVNAEHERSLAIERGGEIDLDRGPAIAMSRDRDLVDEDHQFVEDALHHQNDALSRPGRRDLNAAAVSSCALRAAQRRKLGLPNSWRVDCMPVAAKPRRRTFEFEVPEAVKRQSRSAARGVSMHERLRFGQPGAP